MNGAEVATALNTGYILGGVVIIGFILAYIAMNLPEKKKRKKKQ